MVPMIYENAKIEISLWENNQIKNSTTSLWIIYVLT